VTEAQLASLQGLFETEEEVAFAILFGSAASGRETAESDVDVGAYFVPRREDPCEIDIEEEDAEFESEYELWRACEQALGVNVDFVVLNRAPATIAAAALLTGRLLAVNDGRLYRRFFNEVTTLAEDFRDLVEDFRRIRERSASLSPVDRDRLNRIVEYLRTELADAALYEGLDAARYRSDGHYRRAAERWVENLVNASIDIAKIIVASEHSTMPQTYRGVTEALSSVSPFEGPAGDLAANTRVRNALAHEYLDLRYRQVSHVAGQARDIYGRLVEATDEWLARNSPSA
jgi:uncharacterized protein YutE (UPF0331/DUF86 family)/predicted nucleotidyltransferase